MRRDPRTRSNLPAGFFLTDEARTPDPVATARTLPPGTGVIFRHYNHPDRRRIGCELRDICRSRGQVFLVAGDIGLARDLGADGIHLPERDLMRARRLPASNRWIVTAATHSRHAIQRAALICADAVLVSPIFATASHPASGPGVGGLGVGRSGAGGLGVHRLARLVKGLPAGPAIYALGGLNERNIRKLPPGIDGIAAIGLFLKES